MKVKTYLPIFPGFYNTIFEPDEDHAFELLEIEPNDNTEWDYQGYMKETAELCISWVWNQLGPLLGDVSIDFEKIHSPDEYNFTNDEIYCTIELSKEQKTLIYDYLSTNWEEFDTYLEEKFSSRDGFISFYPKTSAEWIKDFDHFIKNSVGLSSILEFIILDLGPYNDWDAEESSTTVRTQFYWKNNEQNRNLHPHPIRLNPPSLNLSRVQYYLYGGKKHCI